jgi:hypothetical protein
MLQAVFKNGEGKDDRRDTDVSDCLLLVVTSTIHHYLTVTFLSSLLPYQIALVLHNGHQNTE